MLSNQTFVSDSIPRPEHPRPDFQRDDWINLNGRWTFDFDPGQSGISRGLNRNEGFANDIIIPYCPESRLSGVGHTDFIERLWYHRIIVIPPNWANKRILLHFGAVDFDCEAFIDGVSVGRHYGGTSSFSFNIADRVRPGGSHHLVLYVRDDARSGVQPLGKQSFLFASQGCHYTRTTGIWQTVWMEAVALTGLRGVQAIPDLDNGQFVFIPDVFEATRGNRFRVRVYDGSVIAGESSGSATSGVPVAVALNPAKPWSPALPFLYDVVFDVLGADGQTIDSVRSYAGLRKIHIEKNRVFLNNEPLYQRLVLDQGFYPDGIWTAPSDDALKRDIELAIAAGFNGARLHQKVFEPRFHYWADRLGYLTWGESASWGIRFIAGDWKRPGFKRKGTNEEAGYNWLTEWREIIQRDRNHPSIIAWTPFNETYSDADPDFHARLIRDAYETTRALDSTRPVNDVSGYTHVVTDLWTAHHYEQSPEKLKQILSLDSEGRPFRNLPDREPAYSGQPYLVDEFGGIKWVPEDQRGTASGWGYGDAPESLEAFYVRLEGIVDAILSLPHICGYCYTQLTDVEQEQNGLYYYDRAEKFDIARIRRIFSRLPKP
ncbi:MAG: glycoside hydrolase family 2 TIM barrel-domain containing protein [Planctomycetota bacterium]